MRYRFLLVCFLPLGCAGQAGQPQAQAAADAPIRDSSYAVHNLFRLHRHGSMKGASLGLAGLSGAGFEVMNHQPKTALSITAVIAFFTVLDIRQLNRYSESREGLVVRQYELGWPLPADVRRQLKPKYFRPIL
ncbi:hypothetical protein [Hymenobacter negativus]|uniref:Lipoprotein n=1 Tax=Hymenobacter negativus TaxID=2795026 RepID=A0ABS0Q2G0_9BACT|nr:hypothetical protein [Hymenobacter negativus]MBH8556823.1 hypothetical protein [Hymenobacter negativus]